ncbi:hypothetical protein J7K44_00810 [bacterium]|nr:hypothetical protein [bacterium]
MSTKEKIIIFILGLVFFSLYFTGSKYEIDIGIKIIPIDIVTLFLVFAFLIYLLKGNKVLNIKNFSLVLVFLFFIYLNSWHRYFKS